MRALAIHDSLRRRIEARLERRIVRVQAVTRGCTPALRARLFLEVGGTAFIKAATDLDTSDWLRAEHAVYAHVEGPFLPRMLAFDEDGGEPFLLLEDLGDAHWPPPWSEERLAAVLEGLDRTARVGAPPGLPRMTVHADKLRGWSRVAEDPEPFLSLGLADRAWLEAALPDLLAADERTRFEGNDLCHFDVRSDNLCLRDARAIFVDWNWACVGNAHLNLAFFLPSLCADGGPRPEAVLPDAGDVAPTVAGYFAAHAGLPPIPTAPAVRALQRRQLEHALPWAARTLGLPSPASG